MEGRRSRAAASILLAEPACLRPGFAEVMLELEMLGPEFLVGERSGAESARRNDASVWLQVEKDMAPAF